MTKLELSEETRKMFAEAGRRGGQKTLKLYGKKYLKALGNKPKKKYKARVKSGGLDIVEKGE